MSTIAGKLRVVTPDQAVAVGASATVNGTAATKGTATDLALILSNTGGSGTVTPVLQGSNDGVTYTAVNPDKANVTLNSGALPALVGAASVVVAHYAQLQYKQYRVSYTSAATSGTTATDVFVYHPAADSFDATVA